eukprot:SAG11_NODE_1638_length_4535_cov_3.231740_3_plen_68_part_01
MSSGVIVVGNSRTLRQERECWGPWLSWVDEHGLKFGTKRSAAQDQPYGEAHNAAPLLRRGAPPPAAAR